MWSPELMTYFNFFYSVKSLDPVACVFESCRIAILIQIIVVSYCLLLNFVSSFSSAPENIVVWLCFVVYTIYIVYNVNVVSSNWWPISSLCLTIVCAFLVEILVVVVFCWLLVFIDFTCWDCYRNFVLNLYFFFGWFSRFYIRCRF